jgi:hypothetical protein
MRSIERLIRDELAAFIELPERSYYQDDHAELLRMLEAEQWITGTKWKPAYEVFGDFGLTEALGQFVNEFRLWSQEVSEIRGQWFYDHMADELPDDHLSVFGCTSPLAIQLEPMLNRCRRIVRRIDELHTKTEQGEPVESVKGKEAIDTIEPPGLTPLEHRLFELLFKARKQITFDDLFDAWDGDPQDDENVTRNLKRLRKKLPRLQWDFQISEAKRLVTWFKKKGQNVP